MLDETASNEILVWGISVPMTANGRRTWPGEIKALAAERVRSGSRIVDVAREIGATEALVAKWVRAAAPKRHDHGFVELLAPKEVPGFQGALAPGPQSELRIRLGDIEIAVPAGYPAAHLTEVLRAVRGAR